MVFLSRGKIASGAIAVSAYIASSFSALAHHPMDGETPATFMQGLLSGIGHPIIGMDHLAFVIAAGVAACMIGRPLLLPLFFVLATIAGTLVHLMAIDLPLVEFAIAASVAVVGFMVASGRGFSLAAYGAVFAVAGLFHGHAYGEAVFGAETTPVLAYLAGFGLTQYLIAIAAGALIYGAIGQGRLALDNMSARLAGGMVAGAGVLLVSDHLLAAVGLG